MTAAVRGLPARTLAGLALALLSTLTPLASADDPKRPLPDYEGRPPPSTTPGEVALWVPRVVLSPVYFTTEYLIRRPLGAAISAAERANIPTVLYDFFAFGPDHKAGIAPIVFVDFGFNPSVGAYAFWDDAFFKGDDLRLHVSAWTNDWLGGSVVQRLALHGKDSLTFKVVAIRRPDHVFYGIGPGTLESAQSRYGQNKVDGAATFDLPLWRSSRVDAGVGVRYSSFYNGHYGDDPGIEQDATAGVFPLPDGYTSGYTAEYNHLLLALDSRRPFPSEGTGFRLEAEGEQGSDVSRSPGSGWIRYEGAAGGFLDIDGHRRVVSLSVTGIFADPLGSRPIPFTELATLGGDMPMPGFFPGRLVDRSAAVATLRYRWPIAPWVDGSLQVATGNVFGEHLDGFDTRLLRLSAALGVESDNSPDSNFQILMGFGTETFESGGKIDSFRLALGTSRGL